MSTSRDKGTRAETAVVRWLNAHHWPHAERRALRGDRDAGDVTGIPGVVVEVKAARRLDLAEWLDELDVEVANAHATTGLVVARRRGRTDPGHWYALTTLDRAATLLHHAGY